MKCGAEGYLGDHQCNPIVFLAAVGDPTALLPSASHPKRAWPLLGQQEEPRPTRPTGAGQADLVLLKIAFRGFVGLASLTK